LISRTPTESSLQNEIRWAKETSQDHLTHRFLVDPTFEWVLFLRRQSAGRPLDFVVEQA